MVDEIQQVRDLADAKWAEGKAEGKAESAARAVLTVLRVRGIAVPEVARQRIVAERDPARLERWLVRVVLGGTAERIPETSRNEASLVL